MSHLAAASAHLAHEVTKITPEWFINNKFFVLQSGPVRQDIKSLKTIKGSGVLTS